MRLDAFTLMVVYSLVSGLSGFLIAVTWSKNRHIQSLLWWSASLLSLSLGTTLLLTHRFLQGLPAIELGHALFVLTAGLVFVGARKFIGRDTAWQIAFAGPLVWLVVMHLFGDRFSFGDRLALSGGVSGIYYATSGWELLRGKGEVCFSQRLAGFYLFAHTIFLLARFLFPLLDASNTLDQMQVTAIYAFSIFESIIFCLALAFLMLAMTLERDEMKLRNLALTDPLTGATNRRGFEAKAQRLIARDLATGHTTALLAFDLDFFKRVNDTYGHDTGDRVLQVFAETAQSALRSDDIFCRMGGEEFAAILKDTNMEKALAIAERLRGLYVEAGRVIDGVEIGSTTSIGIAVTSAETRTLKSLLETADEALYLAKAHGRNLVRGLEKQPTEINAQAAPDSVFHPA